MSTRELRRAEVLGRVKARTLRLVDAAKMLEVSYRQTKRLWQRYREEGAKGLQHRSAGRSSNRAKPEKFRGKVLQLIREKYSGTEQERFGPTLAAEHLADEDGLEVGEETLRRWMLAEGLWSRVPRRKAHRKRRERRQHFGDLVQLDGSFHAWFEERGPRGCLMNMVDDATATTCCRLGEQETIWAAVGCCARGSRSMAYHERGIPIGRTFISGSRPKGSACVGKRPRRSLDACASDWRFALLLPVLRKRKGGWSATTGSIKIAW